jgi:two-component sensor histidine kinase
MWGRPLLVHENWRGAVLSALITQQLAPFAEVGQRLAIEGPLVLLRAEAAQPIGLALHELATNAMKYGAWSAPSGRVEVSWSYAEPGSVKLSWLERGGPQVVEPDKKGFGHTVIESMAAQSIDGEVTLDFRPTGLSWTLSIPANNVVGSKS